MVIVFFDQFRVASTFNKHGNVLFSIKHMHNMAYEQFAFVSRDATA